MSDLGPQFYARDGSEITLEQWNALLGDDDYHRVALTMIGDIRISTAWLGLDHNWSGSGLPVYFETMIFGGALDQEQWRYSDEASALDGHEYAVRLARVAYQLDLPSAAAARALVEFEERE